MTRAGSFTRIGFCLVLMGAVSCAFLSGARAQTNPPAQTDQSATSGTGAGEESANANKLKPWTEALDEIAKALAAPSVGSAELDRYRADLVQLRSTIEEYAADLRPRLALIEAQRAKLGKPPEKDAPPEPEAVAQQRAKLDEERNQIKASIAGAEALLTRQSDLSNRIQGIRREMFASQLFQRVRSPLSLSLWLDVAANARTGVHRLQSLISFWWDGLRPQQGFWAILAASLGLWLVLGLISLAGIRHFRAWAEEEPPPLWRRAASAAWVSILRALPAIVAAGAFYLMLDNWGYLDVRIETIAFAALQAVTLISAVAALATTILAPNRPHWRILPVSHRNARRMAWLAIAIAWVFGGDMVMHAINDAVYAPVPLAIAQSFVASVLISVLLIAILTVPLGREAEPGAAEGEAAPSEGGESPYRSLLLRLLRAPVWILALAILGAALAGYVALSRFIASQVVITGTILIISYLLLVWINALGQRIRGVEGEPAPKEWMGTAKQRERIALVVTLVLKALVYAVMIPLILLQWGFDRHDLMGWLTKAFYGFRIGNVTISLAAVLAGLVIFLIAYIIARLVQAWIDSQILRPAGLSEDLRDSVRTASGYLGVIIAALLAFSYAGVNFSNIAIVAGALSVGIGFGMQSIVNNFVSGLILLAERPIKVGDWIAVGSDQGFVRRISVRATEIETFDRANVIIPNSHLISEKVQNWTLHNNIGRVVVPVGVSYDSDPEQVRDILLDVARNNPEVLSRPEPFVYFENFDDSSLNFELYAYVLNITRSFTVRTALRIEILKAFRQAGIEIPFPQRDVHLRDLNWLKEAVVTQLARIRAEKAAAAAKPVAGEGESEERRDGKDGATGR